MRRSQALVLGLVVLGCMGTLGATVGCNPQTCTSRGDSTNVTGVVSYVQGSDAGSLISGSIDVFDYEQGCSYGGEEFPVSIGGSCTLWARLQEGAEPAVSYRGVTVFPGNPSGWAAIEPGQVCDLPVAGGVTNITTTDGTVAFAGSTTTLIVTGTVTSSDDAGGTDDGGAGEAFQWQFEGSGVPQ